MHCFKDVMQNHKAADTGAVLSVVRWLELREDRAISEWKILRPE